MSLFEKINKSRGVLFSLLVIGIIFFLFWKYLMIVILITVIIGWRIIKTFLKIEKEDIIINGIHNEFLDSNLPEKEYGKFIAKKIGKHYFPYDFITRFLFKKILLKSFKIHKIRKDKENHNKNVSGLNKCIIFMKIKGALTSETLKERYRTLAKEYHPDKPNGDSVKFQKLNDCNEKLTEYINTHKK